MSKNKITYILVISLVAIMTWFFVKKSMNVSNNSELDSLVKKDEIVVSNSDVWTKFDNGLEIQDVVVGSGAEAKNGDTVSAHYVGTLSDGKKFDSSYDRGEPFSFVLGSGAVIKGWDLGLVGMKVGGKRKLVIPPDLGYGDRNIGEGLIPPNSILFFDVELMATQTPKQ
jgi:FKBP-type peptidyl-prolyl cis-trans isomerase